MTLLQPPPHNDLCALLLGIHGALYDRYGPQGWWPTATGSPWEVMMGAVLTQRTSWTNVVRSLDNLRAARGLDGLANPERIIEAADEELAGLLRPAGHYASKPRRLKLLAGFVVEQGGVDKLVRSTVTTQEMRQQLLSLWGIGPETADAILLYALERPTFVADAYALRLASRWGLLPPTAEYDDVQALFMKNLPHNVRLFNEYHALIVAHGKETCRIRPFCEICPLNIPLQVERHTHTWTCPRIYTARH